MKFNSILNDLPKYHSGKSIDSVIREYKVDKKKIIKLASNENPFGTSKKVISKVAKSLEQIFRYPDDSMSDLKNALAYKYSVKKSNLIIGAGSDQVIEIITKAKCNKKSNVLMAGLTFAMYEISAKKCDAKIIKTKDNQHNLNQLLNLYHKYEIDIIFLCLPNNPLGECLNKNDIYEFLSKISQETLVVVDGVYQEYARYKDKNKLLTPKELIKKFPNVIYLGSFSKAYGLGGLRVGYGIAKKEIISKLNTLRTPFNVTTLSLIAAKEALKDEKFLKKSIKNNFKEMKRFEEFAQNRDIKYIESYTNFITFLLNESLSSSFLCHELLKKGIIVRDLSSYSLNAIRITIGTKKQNLKVLKYLSDFFDWSHQMNT